MVNGLRPFLTRCQSAPLYSHRPAASPGGTKTHLCRDNRARARRVRGRDLHLPVETGGPPENRGLGRVRAGAVLEAFEHGAFRWPPISDGAGRRAVGGQRSRTARVRKSS